MTTIVHDNYGERDPDFFDEHLVPEGVAVEEYVKNFAAQEYYTRVKYLKGLHKLLIRTTVSNLEPNLDLILEIISELYDLSSEEIVPIEVEINHSD